MGEGLLAFFGHPDYRRRYHLPSKFPAGLKHSDQTFNWKTYLDFLRNQYVYLYLVALTANSGCEQGIAVWMSEFFQGYHHLDPVTTELPSFPGTRSFFMRMPSGHTASQII